MTFQARPYVSNGIGVGFFLCKNTVMTQVHKTDDELILSKTKKRKRFSEGKFIK